MNAWRLALAAIGAGAVLASATAVDAPLVSAAVGDETRTPAPAEGYTEEAARYDREALELDAKAEHYARMARHYRTRYTPGSKQGPVLLKLIEQSEQRAQAYRQAAFKAREIARSRRAMAQAG